MLVSFSIPNRIEPSATTPGTRTAGSVVTFQYPQSDRALCNPRQYLHFRLCNHFQYPQSDRALCNLFVLFASCFNPQDFQYPQSDRALCNKRNGPPCPLVIYSFSIPNRIEPSATNPPWPGRTARLPLSVSPIGSSPLQQIEALFQQLGATGFQYPQSDRALCNGDEAPGVRRRNVLSVSPIGSSPLQLPKLMIR